MRRVGAGLADGADRLHEPLAVVRELEDRVAEVVDDPDVLVGIVRAHVNGVRPREHRVPLRPVLDDVAVAVEDEDAVLPARVDAEHAALLLPGFQPVRRHRARGAAGRRARDGRAPDRQAEHGVLEARRDVAQALRRGPLDGGQLAALQHEHAVGALREHALRRAVGPAVVARQLRERLRPVGDDGVVAERVLAAFAAREDRASSCAPAAEAAQAASNGAADRMAHGE